VFIILYENFVLLKRAYIAYMEENHITDSSDDQIKLSLNFNINTDGFGREAEYKAPQCDVTMYECVAQNNFTLNQRMSMFFVIMAFAIFPSNLICCFLGNCVWVHCIWGKSHVGRYNLTRNFKIFKKN
jgi:hypothetical protein